MAITMKNYGLTWTDPDGVPRATVCSYDKGSAEDRKKKLEAAKCKNVRISETKPGELLQPQA
ncbi:hypothetical protein [Streptomyces venezuelae]|uniref:Uncharacterized protein n=1 Tax=Streptomyces venezuelae TaxID=54571 RepID=A0A5P2B7M7_STRVZ|nr:hypothetical protein [Streptomyces venezuelae]QES25788.1 hypothetical protein DEJ47_04385 [Streptomyces venezuelae]